MSTPDSPSTLALELLENKINSASNDVQIHKEIYSFMIAHKDEIAQPGENIPLSILTYTIRRILRPELLPEQIPEMLDLLWHVDACRRRAVENAKKILIFQEFYRKGKTAGQDVELLRPVEEKEIASLADSDGSKKMREAYCECTFLCCRYHIYYLFIASESHLLHARLCAFFPGLNQAPRPSKGLFHCNFSEEELEELEDVQHNVVAFVKEVPEWEEERHAYWEMNGLSEDAFYDDPFQQEFKVRFPPPCEPEEIAEFIETYLGYVEGIVATLNRLFPHKPRSS